MFETPPARRRWSRFSLRAMFVIMTVLALVGGYYGNWIQQRHALLNRQGVVGVTEVGVKNVAVLNGVDTFFAVDPQPSPWPLSWLGEQGYIAVVFTEDAGDDQLMRARALFPEAEVERE